VLGSAVSDESIKVAEAYWQARIPDLPAAPQLPLAKNPATIAKPEFVRRTHRLSQQGWAQLRRSAGAQGVSVSAALLAAFGEVLAAWSDERRLTVNLTTFDRAPLHPDVARLVGDFTTLTLIAMDCTDRATFAARASAVQKRLWSDLDHRAFGGVKVLRALAAQRKSGTAAQMPVVFTSVLDLEDAAPPAFGELVASVAQTPQVWLDHQVMEWNGELILNWDAVEEIFPAGMLDAMFAAYGALIERLAADPAAWTAPVGPLVPPEQLALRRAINAPTAPFAPARLEHGFLERAGQTPEACALTDGERSMSYGELDARSAAVAALLSARGVAPETLIAVMARKGWAQIVAVLGILRSGAAYLPIDPDLPSARVASLLERCAVKVALTHSADEGRIAWPPIERIAIDTLATDTLDREDKAPTAPRAVDDLAYVIFTSGSTGEPKGVMIDHRAAMNTIADVNTRFHVGPGDRVLALSALGFDLSVYDIFGVLGAGGTLVLPAPETARDPEAWAALCRTHAVTLWNTVPALMQMLLEACEDRPDLWPSTLRLVMMSGDWIPVSLPARIRALGPAEVVSLGGATEASIWSIFHPANWVEADARSVPYGKPLTNQSFHVLDSAMVPVPDYVTGELFIGGTGLARGYWRDEDKTAASFVTNPHTGERLYRTGDFGRPLPDGSIEFLGRRDAQVKVNGYRIELGEIEAALAAHPAVEAVAVSAPSDGTNRRLVAHVVSAAPDSAASDAAAPEPEHEGVLTDPVARLSFQFSRAGTRPIAADAELTALPGGVMDDARRQSLLARQSHRRFLERPVSLEALGGLLAALQGIEVPGVPLPKYRYPSASSLNPVQAYVAIKAHCVAGLGAGLYYHDALGHRLAKVADGVPERLFPGTSGALFEAGAFALFLVGRLEAIAPLYGPLSRDFALLEAGYAGQALMEAAPAHDIGLCPIGHIDAPRLTAALAISGETVVHSFVGGPIDPAWAAD
ncbi:MAG: amino acid adenylation domain-containing protein, partial [Pseudomonadota bacterium]